MKGTMSYAALACAAALASVGGAAAQDYTLGTSRAPVVSAQSVAPSLDLGVIEPAVTVHGASVATGGVAMRNIGGGAITISGSPGEVKKAYIYWAIVTYGAPPTIANQIKVQRHLPRPQSAFRTLTGKVVATGPSPCWAGDRTTVFRAQLPKALAKGPGVYAVGVPDEATGSRAGESPWINSTLPYAQGASIVMITKGSGVVSIYDAGLAGTMFHGELSYRLRTPGDVADRAAITLHSIGADGQKGAGNLATSSSAEESRMNGVLFAGPGSTANDSDWNGRDGSPLPQLWDTTAHDVTEAAKAGDTDEPEIHIVANGDCLMPIANVIEMR